MERERESSLDRQARESHLTFPPLFILGWLLSHTAECGGSGGVGGLGLCSPLTDSRLRMPTVSAAWITGPVYSRHKISLNGLPLPRPGL